MGNPPIVVDTCSFDNRDFVRWLASYHGRKIISVVSYAEIQAYFICKKNKDMSYFDKMLSEVNIEIEWFRKEEAMRTAILRCEIGGDIESNFRDLMIASHAYWPPWIVITYDKDFSFLGDRVKTPEEFEKEHHH